MKKKKITQWMALLLALALACGCTACRADEPAQQLEPANSAAEDPGETAAVKPVPGEITAPESEPDYTAEDLFQASYPVRFGYAPSEAKLYMAGNRAYLCLEEIEETFPECAAPAEAACRWPVYEDDGKTYVSLADADVLWGLCAFFRDDKEIELYRRATEFPEVPVSQAAGSEGTAYLRLEDICADQGADGGFTHGALERTRLEGWFLKTCAEGFYIAWIPRYVDPARGLDVDVSRDFSFYNADLVYTLDVLQNCGGRIVLHGLTHQTGGEVSADGTEFAKECRLSAEQITAKFDEAVMICSAMGYYSDIFEFPHYDYTPAALSLAEARFSVIYQQDPTSRRLGQIEAHQGGKGTVYYVPTPADYVYSAYDMDGILERIRKAEAAGQIQSLFFHTYLDADRTIVRADGLQRTYRLDENRNFLLRILRAWASLGCRPGLFDFD
ncbi:MAG: DUF2334 domain-containing protein [Clostridia bacterium]|nr:DUF2334 domain-containing protein [Clostridia bacterium]